MPTSSTSSGYATRSGSPSPSSCAEKAQPHRSTSKGLSAVSYGTTPQSEAAAIAGISGAITSGLNNPKNIDSLVYQALPDLNLPARQPKPLTKR